VQEEPAKKEEQKKEQVNMVQQKTETNKTQPAAKSFVSTQNRATNDYSQSVDVPIDEVKAINLKVSPTYERDRVESVTLKSFRKIVGYDTFNSILKKDRDEAKDEADYYNVTVSMMVKRIPEPSAATPQADPYNGASSLAASLDKGFPYDDGDNSIDDQTQNWKNGKAQSASVVGKLNGENVTKESLVNLVKDTDAPITVGLVQLEELKSDGEVLSAFLGENITRGALKNLVTDKPAPITVALAQKDSDAIALLGANVSIGNLKNLITDKPAPITVALAQKNSNATLHTNATAHSNATVHVQTNATARNDSDVVMQLEGYNVTKGHLKAIITDKPAPITKPLDSLHQTNRTSNSTLVQANSTTNSSTNATGVPVYVNPTLMPNEMANATLDLNMRVGGDNVSIIQKPKGNALSQGIPVYVNPVLMKDTEAEAKLDLKIHVGPDEVVLQKKGIQGNMSKTVLAQGVPVYVNPVLMKDDQGEAKMDMNIKVGPDDISLHKKTKAVQQALAQVKSKNPVVNPPMNNWSVNQPSPPHAQGLAGKADLGQNIIVDGHRVHY
jgi:hypothetical protein